MADQENKSKNPIPKNFEKHMITRQATKTKSEKDVLAPVANGAIGSKKVPMSKTEAGPVSKKTEVKKQAIFSDKNANWVGVGRISRGYNIVTEEAAEAWLTKNYVRQAAPEEVAREFGL